MQRLNRRWIYNLYKRTQFLEVKSKNTIGDGVVRKYIDTRAWQKQPREGKGEK